MSKKVTEDDVSYIIKAQQAFIEHAVYKQGKSTLNYLSQQSERKYLKSSNGFGKEIAPN